MPHAMLKLLPGVNQNMTPTLNQVGVSTSQLIRFMPDGRGGALVQKLGGWVKFFSSTITSIVRNLWAWADINNNLWLAVGAESQLAVISGSVLYDITPRSATDNVAVSATTTINTNLVTITDAGSNITSYDTVFIKTQISVGGLILFGLYPCEQVGANTYNIYTYNLLGQPALATASIMTGGAVPGFTTVSGSSIVTVTLVAHGFKVGDDFAALVSTTVGGVVIFGNYTIVTVPTADTFTIQAALAATSSAGPSYMNGGNARYLYYIGIGPLPLGTGFGVGGFGVGGFGSGTAISANPGTAVGPVTDWTLDNFGSLLIANYPNGPIFSWDPTISQPVATILSAGPSVNHGAFVAMPQRQIIAWGSTFNGIQDPLLLRWCDIEDPGQWIALVTNQAGSFRIPRGSKIVQCLQGPQQGLVWTDLGIWSMQYIGQPFVYSFQEIGNGCGLIGPKAAASVNGVVYWMSQSQFFMLAGDGVQPISCPIWDVIFQDLDTSNTDKIRIAPNSRFNEISWYYPTTTTGEVQKYVKYNTVLGVWDYGTLQRTAWINQSVFGPPIGAKGAGYIYQHEEGYDDDTAPMLPSFQTGYAALSEADVKSFIDQVWPDMKWGTFGGTQNASVQLTFYVADYPGDTPTAYGPYTLTQATQFITPRFRARLLAIEVSGMDAGTFWRMGATRYRYQPDGKF